MKIVIGGAGFVGIALSKYLLSENNTLIIIDPREDLIETINDTMDVQAHVGEITDPEVLRSANIQGADTFISLTPKDEINITSCNMARILFKVSTSVALVNNINYLKPQWLKLFFSDNIPIDLPFSTKEIISNQFLSQSSHCNVDRYYDFFDNQIAVLGFYVKENMELINTSLADVEAIYPAIDFRAIALFHNNQLVVDKRYRIEVGDYIYISIVSDKVNTVDGILKKQRVLDKKKTSSLVIASDDTNLIITLLDEISSSTTNYSITVIAKNKKQVAKITSKYSKVSVVLGDVFDREIQLNANVNRSDIFFSYFANDEKSIISAAIAKELGAKSALISLREDFNMGKIARKLDINYFSPLEGVISTILPYIRDGWLSKMEIDQRRSVEIIEYEIISEYKIVGSLVSKVKLPIGASIIGLKRNNKIISDFVSQEIKNGDTILVFTLNNLIEEVEDVMFV